MMNPVRVLIADDHPLVREGLKRILSMEEGFEIVGECGDGRQAVELCERLHPDIVLMDVHMPEEDGVSAASRLMERCPDVRVVMLSFNDGEEYVIEAFKSGACGYLLKDMDAESLAHALRQVAQGNPFVHPRVTDTLLRQFRRAAAEVGSAGKSGAAKSASGGRKPESDLSGGASPAKNRLTRREMQILTLMAEGKSNREIGERLVISEKTVKNHVSSMMQKMGVHDRTQAVVMAVKNGWLTI